MKPKRKIHLKHPCDDGDYYIKTTSRLRPRIHVSKRTLCHRPMGKPYWITTDPEKVTCARCEQTLKKK
jgi:hypothetical protein